MEEMINVSYEMLPRLKVKYKRLERDKEEAVGGRFG